ncbi:hypothetical protein [Endozoicomonas acroporae]|uniref:hypothetical protein n=1 Tax=Endozoicomonas acroporae TaxID=1701104 RepID=UPI0013D515B1|nr:hypothetical protein [Endozoicomonas acroporae]
MNKITLCLCVFVVQLLLTGCETQPVKPQPTTHIEKGRDVFKTWAVTGCVAGMESTPFKRLERTETIALCRSMAELFKKNQCNLPIPVNRSTERTL